MSITQEYNYLITMLEENIGSYDTNYHMQKKLTTTAPKRSKQNKRKRPHSRMPNMDLEQDPYQIDYSQVNRPNCVK